MAWPTPQDYSEAVQSPAHCFQDPELCSGTVETDRLGLPRPIAGGFAVVYRIRTQQKSFAVRCFHSEVKDLQERYYCIQAALKSASLPYFVPFSFIDSGIRIKGKWYPVIKMEWTNGETLIDYVRTSLQNPVALEKLASDWHLMCASLTKVGIAHGDLQHGNVLVSSGRIILLDYDGMFVPSLHGKPASELGHPNYQHPEREAKHFGPWLDGFAASSIMASLLAFSVDKRLWDQVKAGDESLLFRRADYDSPATSQTLALLKSHHDKRLRQLAHSIEELIRKPLHMIGLPKAESLGFDIVKSLPGDGSWLGPFVPRGPAHITVPSPPVEPQPPVLPVLPDWLIPNPSPIEALTFGASHRVEKYAFSLVILGALIPAVADGTAGMIASALLVPTSYLGWRKWMHLRFEKHPLTVEKQHVESSLPDETLVLGQAMALRAKWSNKAEELKLLQNNLQSVPRRLEEKRLAMMKSQNAEMDQARERFKQARAQVEKQEVELTQRESAEVEGVRRQFDAKIAQLQKSLSDLNAQRSSEGELLWEKSKSLRQQISVVSGKYSKKRSKQVAVLNREKAELTSKIAELSHSLQSELAGTLKALQDNHVSGFLSSKRISSAEIDGIGPVLTERLESHGIQTAADVRRSSLDSIMGIGSLKKEAIRKWRKHVEREAARSMPVRLPSPIDYRIRERFATMESDLHRRMSVCQETLKTIDSRLIAEEQGERSDLQNLLSEEESRVRPLDLKIKTKYEDLERNLNTNIRAEVTKRDIAVDAVRRRIAQLREKIASSRNASEQQLNNEVAAITLKYQREFQKAEAGRRFEEDRIKTDIREAQKALTDIAIAIQKSEEEAADIRRQLSRYSRITFKEYLSEAFGSQT